MFRFLILAAVLFLSSAVAVCGQSSNGQNPDGQANNPPHSTGQNSSDQAPVEKNAEPPHSQEQGENSSANSDPNSDSHANDRLPSASSNESSSKSSQIDITPPEGDDKDHPDSASAVREGEEEAAPSSQVEEFHSWDPHKAAKSVEVGDYYYKLGNYKAALSRYQEALEYKQNDAVANFRTAQCQEKLNNPQDAVEHYEAYLKILPNGSFSKDARKALAKLQANSATPGKPQ